MFSSQGSTSPPARGRWRRVAAASLVMAGMTGPLLGLGAARAQEDGTLSLAAITPSDAAVYAEILLDPEREQLRRLDEILLELGSEESFLDALSDVNVSGSSSIDLTGAEVALVLLPSALEGQDTGSVVSDGLSGDTEALTGGLADAADTSEGIVLLVKPTDLDAAVEAVEEQLIADAGSEADVESETVDGVEVRSAVDDAGESQAYAVVDDILVVGSVSEDVTPFIGVADADSLAGRESFATASDLLPDERAAFAFLNGGAFLDILEVSEDANTQLVTDLAEDLANLDTDQGIALVADEPGLRVETVEVPADGSSGEEAGGVAADLTTADRVPADTLLFVNGFDLGRTALLEGTALLLVSALTGALDGDDADLDEATPVGDAAGATPVADDVDALFEEASETLGVNLQTEFLDTLAGQYAFALWDVDLDDPTNISAVLTSDVADVAALDDTLAFVTLFVQAGLQGTASVETRTVAGTEINNVTVGDASAPVSIDYGIVDDELLIGVGDGVDAYVEGPDASLADDETYQETLGYLPAEYDGVFYTDVAALQGLTSDLDSVSSGLTSEDASEECSAYDSREEAQAAYDADPSANFELDLDFDGEACEDFFTADADGTPGATPVAEALSEVPVGSLAIVSYKRDGYAFTSSILTLTDE